MSLHLRVSGAGSVASVATSRRWTISAIRRRDGACAAFDEIARPAPVKVSSANQQIVATNVLSTRGGNSGAESISPRAISISSSTSIASDLPRFGVIERPLEGRDRADARDLADRARPRSRRRAAPGRIRRGRDICRIWPPSGAGTPADELHRETERRVMGEDRRRQRLEERQERLALVPRHARAAVNDVVAELRRDRHEIEARGRRSPRRIPRPIARSRHRLSGRNRPDPSCSRRSTRCGTPKRWLR